MRYKDYPKEVFEWKSSQTSSTHERNECSLFISTCQLSSRIRTFGKFRSLLYRDRTCKGRWPLSILQREVDKWLGTNVRGSGQVCCKAAIFGTLSNAWAKDNPSRHKTWEYFDKWIRTVGTSYKANRFWIRKILHWLRTIHWKVRK